MLDTSIIDQISADTQRLLGDLGLSTEHIKVSMDPRCLIIQLEHFYRSAGDRQIRLDESDMLATRDLIVDYVMPDLMDTIRETAGIDIDCTFYDWHDGDFSGLIVGMTGGQLYRQQEDYYAGKDDIHRQIAKITYDIQKVPDKMYSFWAGRNTLVIVREGIFIRIEKELIKLGYRHGLLVAKRALEKEAIVMHGRAEDIFNRKLLGTYVDWDFDRDKSALVYVFEQE